MLTFCYTQVIDTNEASISAGGALDDVSKVEKFKIDDAKYEASGGSDFRKFRSGKRKTEPVHNNYASVHNTLGSHIGYAWRTGW